VTDTFDEQVISEFRARAGIVSGLQDLSLLWLHHFGAKSGSGTCHAARVLVGRRQLRRSPCVESRRTTTSGLVLQPPVPPNNDRGNRGGDVVGSGSGGGCPGAPQDDRPIGGV